MTFERLFSPARSGPMSHDLLSSSRVRLARCSPAGWVLAAACIAAPSAQAWTLVDKDQSFSSFVSDHIVVGFKTFPDFEQRRNGTSPTLTLLDGAGALAISTFNGSTLSITGLSSSRAGMHAPVFAYDGSTIDMSAGRIDGFTGHDSASMRYSGGEIGNAVLYGGSSLQAFGGRLGDAYALERSSMQLTGSTIINEVEVRGSATATLSEVRVGAVVRLVDTAGLTAAMINVGGNLVLSGRVNADIAGATIGGSVLMTEGQLTLNDATVALDARFTGGGGVLNNTRMSGQLIASRGAAVRGLKTDAWSVDVINASASFAELTVTNSVSVHGGSFAATGATMKGMEATQSDVQLSAFSISESAAFRLTGSNVRLQSGQIGQTLTISDAPASLLGVVVGSDASVSRSSKLVMDGSTIQGALRLSDASDVQISRSSINGELRLSGRQGAVITASTIARDVSADGTGTLTFIDTHVQGEIRSFNGVHLKVTGGSVAGNVAVYNSSGTTELSTDVAGELQAFGTRVVLSGGRVGGASSFVTDGSYLQTGGVITERVTFYGSAQVDIQGGTIGAMSITGNAVLTHQGGRVVGDGVSVSDAARLTTRSDIGYGLLARDNSFSTLLAGAQVGRGGIGAVDNASILMVGGEVLGNIILWDTSRLVFLGGSVGGEIRSGSRAAARLAPARSGDADASELPMESDASAPPTGRIVVHGQSEVTFVGLDLTVDMLGDSFLGGTFSRYRVSGHLQEGDAFSEIDFYLENGTGARYALLPSLDVAAVPEPSTLAMGLVGGLLLIGMARRRRG